MNLYIDNVNFGSTSGPNHFGTKLKKYLEKLDVNINNAYPDVQLSFIEMTRRYHNVPLVQRLDGIYFNKAFNYRMQNKRILETYKNANGVVFQSDFNKKLTFQYFGYHNNSVVIRNGADTEFISKVNKMENDLTKKYDKIWSCASSWRPHKRLNENINYFLENSSDDDGMFIAGDVQDKVDHDRIHYMGNLNINDLISMYKASDYFIHLAWLDHCPNVVVDARACGCKIVCSNTGGTSEIAGPDAIIIKEQEWDFSPIDLYNPPAMKFSLKSGETKDSDYSMDSVAKQYKTFLEKIRSK